MQYIQLPHCIRKKDILSVENQIFVILKNDSSLAEKFCNSQNCREASLRWD